jgi:hypothetical protein
MKEEKKNDAIIKYSRDTIFHLFLKDRTGESVKNVSKNVANNYRRDWLLNRSNIFWVAHFFENKNRRLEEFDFSSKMSFRWKALIDFNFVAKIQKQSK